MYLRLFLRSRLVKKIRYLLFTLGAILVFLVACKLGPTDGSYLRVDAGRCTGCRSCVSVCESDAIIIIDNKAVIDPTKCIECGKCVYVCPTDAIE